MRALFNVLSRIWRVIVGVLFQGVKTIEAGNPKAVLEAEIDQFNTAQADFNKNLGKQAGSVHRLKAQVKKDETSKAALEGRIRALLKFGEGTPERAKAATTAITHKATCAQLEENKVQLESAESLLVNLTKQRDTFVKTAQAKIQRVKGLIGKAEMAEATAKMATMASDLQFNPDGSGLSELEESLEARTSDAKGQTQVANEAAASSPWAMTAAEQEADEASALADFEAQFADPAPEAAPAADAPKA